MGVILLLTSASTPQRALSSLHAAAPVRSYIPSHHWTAVLIVRVCTRVFGGRANCWSAVTVTCRCVFVFAADLCGRRNGSRADLAAGAMAVLPTAQAAQPGLRRCFVPMQFLWSFCLALLVCVSVRLPSSSALFDATSPQYLSTAIDALEQSDRMAILQHLALLHERQAALRHSGDIRARIDRELTTAESLTAALMESLANPPDGADDKLRTHLATVKENLASVHRALQLLGESQRQLADRLRSASFERDVLRGSLATCQSRLNHTVEFKQRTALVLGANLRRMSDQIDTQEVTLMQMQQELVRLRQTAAREVVEDTLDAMDEEHVAQQPQQKQPTLMLDLGSTGLGAGLLSLANMLSQAMGAAHKLREEVKLDQDQLATSTDDKVLRRQLEQQQTATSIVDVQFDAVPGSSQDSAQFARAAQHEPPTQHPPASAPVEPVAVDSPVSTTLDTSSVGAAEPPTPPLDFGINTAAAAGSPSAEVSPQSPSPESHSSAPPELEKTDDVKSDSDDDGEDDEVVYVKELPLHEQKSTRRRRALQQRLLVDHPMPPFPQEYLPSGRFGELSSNQDPDTFQRQQSVRSEFLHAWTGYRQHAWGFDELHPVTRKGSNSQYYMALTMIDALDTLILMGFDDEVRLVRAYLAKHLSFQSQEDINVFETTIRVMGGLLSAYALTHDSMYSRLATEIADGMLVAFNTPTGMPYGTVGLRTRTASNPSWAAGSSTMSEIGSIQLEWQYLSRVTGNPVYARKVDVVTQSLYDLHKSLYPQFINVEKGHFSSNVYTFGARVDSIYEYFLKQYLMSGRRNDKPLAMYIDSMRAMDEQLIQRSKPMRAKRDEHDTGEDVDLMTYVAELHGAVLHGKMDHLVCFVPGMLALGAWSRAVAPNDATRHMELAKKLMRTCVSMYVDMGATGLAPEIVQFDLDPENGSIPGMKIDANAAHSMLRPETVESLFILWRVTHDQVYRDWGWRIFESMRKYCRLAENGYSGLKDVRSGNRPDKPEEEWNNWNDKMESFFLSETLKYLYLLFSPDELLPLDRWVLNTEAHPLPIDLDDEAVAEAAARKLFALQQMHEQEVDAQRIDPVAEAVLATQQAEAAGLPHTQHTQQHPQHAQSTPSSASSPDSPTAPHLQHHGQQPHDVQVSHSSSPPPVHADEPQQSVEQPPVHAESPPPPPSSPPPSQSAPVASSDPDAAAAAAWEAEQLWRAQARAQAEAEAVARARQFAQEEALRQSARQREAEMAQRLAQELAAAANTDREPPTP